MKIFIGGFLLLLVLQLTAQVHPVRVKLADSHSFSMILLPDPQSYIKFDVNQPLFDLMTAWTAHNVDFLNVKAVLCTGDLVEQNELAVADGINGNQTSRQQWTAASKAFERLDGIVPYVICTGNHDYGYQRSENRFCRFPQYFPPERNCCWKSCLVSVGKNWQGYPTLENAAYEFEDEHWGKMLIISLEFAPRDEALAWAKQLCESSRYCHHKAFVLTHSYLEWDGSVIEKENYRVNPANYGKAIWEKLVYPCENIKMVVCGHACEIAAFKDNVSFRVDRNAAGKLVSQMMFNAQTADGQWHGNGGDGWLRILEFMPDGKTIQVRTFSPLFAISPTTAKNAWRREKYDEFEITIE